MLFTQKFWVSKLVDQILLFEGGQNEKGLSKQAGETVNPIHLTTEKITEENFSGSMPVISGANPLAIKMREYVQTEITEFKKEADANVPGMREKFGTDSPMATYTIDLVSKYIKSAKTESIETSVYSFTGGAHGNTIYKVITTDRSSGKVLVLSNVIKKVEQNAFTEFVKKQLNNWRPEGSDVSPVFTDEVKDLTFNSFANWSLDDKNLTLYFDQYAIGPGALGATAFPLSLEQIKNFLQ